MRVKASAMGLDAQEYRAELAVTSGWTGLAELAVSSAQIDELFDTEMLDIDEARDLPCHTGLVLYPTVRAHWAASLRRRPSG